MCKYNLDMCKDIPYISIMDGGLMTNGVVTDPILLQYEGEMRQYFCEDAMRERHSGEIQRGAVCGVAVLLALLTSAGISCWVIYAVMRSFL
jgi:hypothetical protein